MLQDHFVNRHIGPRDEDVEKMLEFIGVSSLEELIDQTVPSDIRLKEPLSFREGLTEHLFFKKIYGLARKNKVFSSYIGMGYYNTITPVSYTHLDVYKRQGCDCFNCLACS